MRIQRRSRSLLTLRGAVCCGCTGRFLPRKGQIKHKKDGAEYKAPPTPGCAPFTYGARVISTIGNTGRSLYKCSWGVGNAIEAFIPRMLLAQSKWRPLYGYRNVEAVGGLPTEQFHRDHVPKKPCHTVHNEYGYAAIPETATRQKWRCFRAKADTFSVYLFHLPSSCSQFDLFLFNDHQ